MKYAASPLFALLAISLAGFQDPSTGIRPTDASLVKAIEKEPQETKKPAPAPTIKTPKVINESLVMVEGALYFRAENTIFPVPGGGASGCFSIDPRETHERIERARAAFAKSQK